MQSLPGRQISTIRNKTANSRRAGEALATVEYAIRRELRDRSLNGVQVWIARQEQKLGSCPEPDLSDGDGRPPHAARLPMKARHRAQ
ncbi:competence system putative prepilin ComGE [Bosea sp. LC85]|uniref:competence system putative prepilin ComGE n=1 Tax=Bosea sp. LC85 TaxID=1502851 RepID=UPI0034E25A1F